MTKQGAENGAQSPAAFWLGPESPLADELAGFAPRPGQVEMARAVERALERGIPLLVEAGTGTGKTLAYLVPAVASGLKVVVSTGTRTLQDQVSEKELPLLRRAMDPELTWDVLKGRTNYLCLLRYQQFRQQPELKLRGAAGALARLEEWAGQTESGDLDQVRGQGMIEAVLAEVTATSEQCLAGRCPRREECYLMEARRRAAEARVVVVNHHLFLADLMLKAQGFGEALPRYQAVVFDEAHLLPEVATSIFGVSVSRHRIQTLVRDLGRLPGAGPGAAAAGAAVEAAGRALFNQLKKLAGPGGSCGLTPQLMAKLAPPAQRLAQALEEMAAALGDDEMAENLAGRAQALVRDLDTVRQPVEGHSVAWLKVQGRQVSLNLSPVEVGPHLEAALYQDLGRLVFTSATLAAGGDLEPMRQRLGLDRDTHTLVVPTPFDLAGQALLYVPRSFPQPNQPEFPRAVAREVAELLELSRGRAFVLFTSHRNLEAVSGLLRERLPFPCLVQGQAPRMELLRRFVKESPSVLFATASFWQGVDVPGPALSAVIVDKLPFAPPDDPLLAARMHRLEQEENKSGFAHIMLPEAVLSLKQGLGRLLRSPRDRGLLAVLDVRLRGKPYGRVFLKALKPIPLTQDKAAVAAFFAGEPGSRKPGPRQKS